MDIGHVVLIVAVVALGAWAAAASMAAAARKREAAKTATDAAAAAEQAAGELAEAKTELVDARAQTERVRKEAEQQAEQRAKADRESQVNAFKGVASEVLTQVTKQTSDQVTDQFKAKADNALAPVLGQLKTLETRNKEFQEQLTATKGDYGKVGSKLEDVVKATSDLTSVLSSSSARGNWGEQTLQRIVEFAGMTERVDYDVQVSITGSSGGQARPDALIHIPGGLSVIVDSKAPFDQYRLARDADSDEARDQHLAGHAKAVLARAEGLGKRDYIEEVRQAKNLASAPEFVVMFLPTDGMFYDALAAKPSLWEDAWIKHRVLIVTPVNLIAFLQTVALAWHQQAISERADQIAAAGAELSKRINTFATHLAKVGRGLNSAVSTYNDSVGSYNSRLVPGAQKLAELRGASGQVEELPTITELPTTTARAA